MLGEKNKQYEENSFEWDTQAMELLREKFKLQKFRENQRPIINATMSGKDVLGLIPTGGGKSLTFQISALLGSGVSIVIMPLKALIRENVQFCEENGISCCELTSNRTFTVRYSEEDCYDEMLAGAFKMVFTTPEKVIKNNEFKWVLQKMYKKGLIDRFVVDEIHVVKKWGDSFRQSYRNLK